MAWKFNQREAVFLQIANRLRGEILGGKYPPDSQIPPVRQLAYEASVNPNTMQKALTLLEEEGLLRSRGTVGRFITSDVDILAAAKEKVRREAVKNWLYTPTVRSVETTTRQERVFSLVSMRAYASL